MLLHAKRSMQIVEIRYLWPSFNDFAIRNFASFIAVTLIIAVCGTMALQLTKVYFSVFQCSVTYSMEQTRSCFDCCNAFIDFIVRDCKTNKTIQMN